MAAPPQKAPPRTPQAPGTLWDWWLILLALLVWNAVSLFPHRVPSSPRQNILGLRHFW
jgi:hypothetical protein